MSKKFAKPFLVGFTIAALLFIVCSLITIPLYDGVFHYSKGLVKADQEGRIAMTYFFGNGLEHARFLGLTPQSFELKGMGYVLFTLIHIGFPFLIGYRVYLGEVRKSVMEK